MSGAKVIQEFDGAHPSAAAVLALVRLKLHEGIQDSWDDERRAYRAEPRFVRFDNCREQGYIIFMQHYMPNFDKKQINIAFAENRSSDDIVVYVFETATFNAPTVADFPEEVWTAGRHFFKYNEHYQAAEFISEQLVEFWAKVAPKKEAA